MSYRIPLPLTNLNYVFICNILHYKMGLMSSSVAKQPMLQDIEQIVRVGKMIKVIYLVFFF